jgi:DNA-binding CsgD family transcriptional regulator
MFQNASDSQTARPYISKAQPTSASSHTGSHFVLQRPTLPTFPLRGREAECEHLRGTLSAVLAGQSRVIVLRGEAGIGKSALLEYAAQWSPDFDVIRVTGIESEMELAFAGLHQLCAPMLERDLHSLPEPQREALVTALGIGAGATPDRFLVGLATLTLLASHAEDHPLVCLIDDAQWLDPVSLQIMSFVARRLDAEQVALIIAVREPSDTGILDDLPELVIHGLSDQDARRLLDDEVHGPLDVAVRDRIVAESHGNPLALLEMPRGMTSEEIAGGFGFQDGLGVASRIEFGFQRRVQQLPKLTRRLMLVAALEPTGDVMLMWRAAELLGVPEIAAGAAEAEGLMDIGSQVRFRHPLVRSAVRRSALAHELEEVHNALAEVTDSKTDPDRRAWHLAQASIAPNEYVAAELERSAGRAQVRGGISALAAFLQRSSELTPDPTLRSQRALAAAKAKHRAGSIAAAEELLLSAERGPLSPDDRADANLLRAQISFTARRDCTAPLLLMEAANQLEPLDPTRARDTYLDAFAASLIVGRLSKSVDRVANAARAMTIPNDGPMRAPDYLLKGFSIRAIEGGEAGAPFLRQGLDRFLSSQVSPDEDSRWSWLAGRTAMALWDDDAWQTLTQRHLVASRRIGALNEIPLALNSRVFVHLFAGELGDAGSLVAEAASIRGAIRSDFAPYGALGLAAWRGDQSGVREIGAIVRGRVVPRGEGIGVSVAHWADALLLNGLGRYDDAAAAAAEAAVYPAELGFATWGLVELVEAASRSGQSTVAHAAFAQLVENTAPGGTAWANGVESRSRALVTEGAEAESHYLDSIRYLGQSHMRAETARARLLYGEWLRRENRRLDARVQLRLAHQEFSAMGAMGFAERSRRELAATGETVRKRSAETGIELTAQEAQIAVLARDGSTNPEIAAELFISPRTVEWHLRKVYPKLGITSRKELRGLSLRA